MKKKPRAMIGKVPVWCAHDKIVDCVELKPNPKNPNTHPAKQIKLLGKIIAEQGWRMPITVSKRSGLIVKGHARLEAAFKAGILKAPVDLQDYESEAAEHADMVADNRLAELAEIDDSKLSELLLELSDLDIDMDLTGFFDDELKELLGGQKGLTEDDEIPDIPKIATTKLGDIYVLGDHRLLCGDAKKQKDVERLMDGKMADMVFTDPPYNVDYGNTAKDSMRYHSQGARKILNDSFGSEKEFEDFLNSFITAAKPFVAGDVYICMSSSMLHVLHNAFSRSGGHWSTFIIWVKNTFTIGMANHQRQYESILYGWFQGTSHYWSGVRNLSDVIEDDLMYDGDGVPLVRVEPGGIESDIWNFPKPHKNKLHPTMKPVALCSRAIVNSSIKDGIVLDVFGGSESTLIACEKNYRRCRMMELDQLYCDVIVKRWENYTGSKAKLI